MLHKSISSALRRGAGSDGTPTAEQAALINGFTLRDFKPEELYTRTFALAHNCIDRDIECIDEALLERFAKTLPGKGLFNKHPMGWDGDSGYGEGRWYAAYTQRMPLKEARELLREPELQLPPDRSEVMMLFTSAYMVRTPGMAELITKVDAGVAGDVSIGFVAGSRTPIVDPASKSVIAERLNGPGEGLEASFVWLGAQTGARAIKTVKESIAMTPEQLAALKLALGTHAGLLDNPASLKAVFDDAATYKVASTTLATLKTALGDNAALLDSPAELVHMVVAGKEYTGSMIDDLVAADRTATPQRCGDTPEAMTAARKLYAAYAVPLLKHLHGLVTANKTAGASLPGSDPNARKQPPEKTDGTKAAALSII